MKSLYSYIKEMLVTLLILLIIFCTLIFSGLVAVRISFYSLILFFMLFSIITYSSTTINWGIKAIIDLLFKQYRTAKGKIIDIIPYKRSFLSEKWSDSEYLCRESGYSCLIRVKVKNLYLTLIADKTCEIDKESIFVFHYGRFSHIVIDVDKNF